jgi:hypothetical protein
MKLNLPLLLLILLFLVSACGPSAEVQATMTSTAQRAMAAERAATLIQASTYSSLASMSAEVASSSQMPHIS